MNISNSPDINNLSIQVTWDLAGALPIIRLLNQSQGSNLAGISWAFTAISPSGTYIEQGNIDQPDITGEWTTYVMTNSWPRPFNSIEWSGLPYQFFVTIIDSNGNVISSEPQLATICRPVGNTQKSTTAYGIAKSDVRVQCQQARIFFQDTTYHFYKGQDGTIVSSSLKVIYPIDETQNIPDPFSIANYSTALVPISYSSTNYQFIQSSVYDYTFDNNTIIRIKYQLLRTFAVWCNIDLMPLQCEISKISDEIINGNCADVQQAQTKLNAIIPKFMLVVMGTLQPLLGVDVPKLIEEIQLIGGFNCNCCTVPTGIIPTTASIIDGYSFSVNKLGGDGNGHFTNDGSNIVLNIGDVSYVVRMGLASPSSFSASAIYYTSQTAGDGFTKTYYLNIDGINFQRELLVNISNDPYSLNYLNSLINTTQSNFQLIVDGGCIFQSTSACDYSFGFSNIPVSTTFALLTSIKVSNNTVALNFAFNQTNLTDLQGYLNGLGYGTFVVTNLGSGNITITSTANSNQLLDLTYQITSTNYISDFGKNCTGFVPKSANEVVQSIIYYICGLDDTEIKTSQVYIITYINPDTGTTAEETVNGGVELNDFIIALLDRGVDTINYIINLSKLNCTNIRSNFPLSSNIMQSNDVVLGTKNGVCAEIFPVELGTRQLQLGAFDPAYFSAFCNMVNLCSGGHPCTPFSVLSLSVVDHSPNDNEQDIIVTFINDDSQFDSVRIAYARIDNTSTPVYTFIPGVILPGNSPYTIPNLPQGQYSVEVRPLFNDGRVCPSVFMETAACTGINAFNAVLDSGNIVVTYSVSTSKLKVNIVYPNGGTFSQIYNNGDSISVTPPAGVYGNYTVTLQAVCNETTGFFSVSSAPAIVSIPQPTGIVTATAGISLTAGFYVANIGGIPLFALNNNLAYPNTQTGIHAALVAQPISFSVVSPTETSSLDNGVDIYVNAAFVARVEFNTGTGVYSSGNITANATDAILLDFNNDA